MNLLAQQGFSTMPSSPFRVIGQAGLATAENQRLQRRDNLQTRLLESQIGLNEARSAQGPNPTAGNVQSTFKGENGNMHIITRDGRVQDTGVPFNNNLQLLEQADGSVVAVDRSTGQQVGTPVTPDQARDAAQTAAQTREDVAAGQGGTEMGILRLETQLGNIDQVLADLRSGDLKTGFFQGRASGLSTEGQRMTTLSGKNVIDLISSATFGQLSEGERRFLESTTFNLLNTEERNIEQIEEFRRITEKALELERRRLQRLGGEVSDSGSLSAPSQFNEGQTATNPTTGERLVFRNGQWVPLNE